MAGTTANAAPARSATRLALRTLRISGVSSVKPSSSTVASSPYLTSFSPISIAIGTMRRPIW